LGTNRLSAGPLSRLLYRYQLIFVKDEAAIIPLFPSDSLKAHIKTRESSMD
jgi:hypothetical protein